MSRNAEVTPGLFEAASTVRNNAHAPYSGYKVGAAVLCESGAIHVGCNVENAAYPQGLCAEAAAIAAMVAAGGSQIREVCLVTSGPKAGTPCGGCRQKLAEFARPDTLVFIATPGGIETTFTMAELLPHGFDAATLDQGDNT